jgi:hypothetical protein
VRPPASSSSTEISNPLKTDSRQILKISSQQQGGSPSTSPARNKLRRYVCDHNSAPPAHQYITTGTGEQNVPTTTSSSAFQTFYS